MPTVAAIILAAGSSTRMGQFKPLLQVNGQTLIQRAIAVFRKNRLEDIIVVTGHRAADLEAALGRDKVHIARNESYARGMFSSVKVGMRHLPARCTAFFVLPTDMAFVKPATIGRLISAYRDHPGRICYPCLENRCGHPPLIPARLAHAIADHDGKGGLRRVLKRWADLALEVTVADPHILHDLDTPEDLLTLGRMIRSTSI
jgi:CTP:molybdopterin cytidylyltransferase MocA